MIINPFKLKKRILELQRLDEKTLERMVTDIYVGKYNMSVDDVAECTMLQQIITCKRMKSGGVQ